MEQPLIRQSENAYGEQQEKRINNNYYYYYTFLLPSYSYDVAIAFHYSGSKLFCSYLLSGKERQRRENEFGCHLVVSTNTHTFNQPNRSSECTQQATFTLLLLFMRTQHYYHQLDKCVEIESLRLCVSKTEIEEQCEAVCLLACLHRCNGNQKLEENIHFSHSLRSPSQSFSCYRDGRRTSECFSQSVSQSVSWSQGYQGDAARNTAAVVYVSVNTYSLSLSVASQLVTCPACLLLLSLFSLSPSIFAW